VCTPDGNYSDNIRGAAQLIFIRVFALVWLNYSPAKGVDCPVLIDEIPTQQVCEHSDFADGRVGIFQ
jgi:hypothetical protein